MLVTAFHFSVAEDVADGGGVVGGEILNVTGIVVVCQVPTLMVRAALYVPAPLPLVLTATVSCLLLVIDVLAGDTDSQVALSEAVSVTVLELVLETVIV